VKKPRLDARGGRVRKQSTARMRLQRISLRVKEIAEKNLARIEDEGWMQKIKRTLKKPK